MRIEIDLEIGDFDAEDLYTLRQGPEDVEVGDETVPMSDPDGAVGFWVLSQGSRVPEDASWVPPTLVPRRVVRELLSAGVTTLRSGFEPEKELRFRRVERDALEEEAAETAAAFPGPVVCALSDEGDELVVSADPSRAQLVYYHTLDVCTVVWRRGFWA